MIPMPDRPGGGQAVLRGCRCDFVENRGGRGVGGLVVGIDQDGVAHRIDAPVYVVREGCPVHAPRTPWWLTHGLILAGAVTSWLVSVTLDWLWLTPLPAGLVGLVSGVAVMLGGARWYDVRRKRRNERL